ncbi:hypothetical protein LEP1GSC016_1404 [Leptospira borgpetersenii serovar Hardjo-bovis str. Sponselee]|uniref:Uncharacterized protein n=1 Tax=Leptospira borgpetersenii serovar Hardjo-bovis str. Sponselee TaxID=1303729 RepID=M6BLG7_LEPBO|nr:hypothetical protein B9T54_18435 [Leptospira borgpetersenii serovar Hardjo-bovis]AYR10324.1 hypothetical protein D1609_18325 [Leptospira borgpetersenii serovar Hardjo-bovis]EMJ80389.1 hypothetical protein LEP1GSC016_1404 [Leptospira borgpetersenii serovar Hardjo-bovis str. Sponselee]TQE53896.1 hypothetical protein FFZ95_05835 [Leptospira borgpetersenii]TQE57920.1 hypothetical protein FFZ96_05415 [Leptospira borgpetersenii]
MSQTPSVGREHSNNRAHSKAKEIICGNFLVYEKFTIIFLSNVSLAVENKKEFSKSRSSYSFRIVRKIVICGSSTF